MTEPTFVLADGNTLVTAHGRRREWTSLSTARSARGAAVVGAVSFDPDSPDALWEPESLEIRATPHGRADRPPRPPAADPAAADALTERPSPEVHRSRVADVVALIRGGVAGKVVLGRSERLTLTPPVAPHCALAGFRATDPHGNGYLVDVGEGWLVGSSPELLVARRGDEVSAFPLAGTRPRVPGCDDDEARRELLDSDKDLDEHRFVTRSLVEALGPVCRDLDVPDRPVAVATPTAWHLGTPLRGRLTGGDDLPTALDLVALVHPTPAVCGSPDVAALDLIRAVEGRGARGFFGGAVGWCDAAGDGHFRVTIRGAVLDPDGRAATVWAGGGLTADSDPDLELAETVAKLARARQGLAAGAALAGTGTARAAISGLRGTEVPA